MPSPNPAAFAFLATRRSHSPKLFKPPVPDHEELMQILTAAVRVPDHGKLEPWRLIVVEKTGLTRLADLAEARARALGGDAEKIGKGRGQYDQGLLAVVVISAPKPVEKIPLVEQRASAAALCMNLVNAAEAKGWGACWLTGWPAHDPEFARQAFDCQGEDIVMGVIQLGTPPAEEAPDRPRPDLARIARVLT
jgi:nitroreductase